MEETNKFGVKIICCRWVTNAKVIKDKMGVRARIVVKHVAVGPKAKTFGISSPTPSAESIKVALAVRGFSNSYVWTRDWSAAFMHTPLNNSRKSIVKLPVSISWEENTAAYVDLAKSLNGIKSSQVSPNARGRAQCKGGGGKEKYMYVHTNDCTICRRLSENVVATFTWSRNVGKVGSKASH